MAVSAPPIPLLYEDDALVVVDKPAGLPVIAAPDWPAADTVQARVAAQLGSRLWVVHRLDRETSGALAFARTADAHRLLSMAFEGRDVAKTYRALTSGCPTPGHGTIDVPLHAARRGRSRPARPDEPGSRDATTVYRVLAAWRAGADTAALVEASPRTGRQHQIRVHLRAIGAPILADPVYGRATAGLAARIGLGRLALHACVLDLPHPSGGRRVQVTAPWPADLEAAGRWLDAHAIREVAT
ncbi:MAG: RluA family pseudouridine synthase [Vicinamibacterales bacterium]